MNKVTYSLELLPEDIPYVGNCSAVGAEHDHAVEQWIRNQLAAGNDCAWCVAIVVARWNGYEGRAYLGACSYEGWNAMERDLLSDASDLKSKALSDLQDEIRPDLYTGQLNMNGEKHGCSAQDQN